MTLPEMESRAEVVVDLDAIADNVATLRQRVPDAAMMTVVKADGYGHGLVESARAARAGGADWLGVAVLEEALALRAAGDTGPLLTWLTVPGEELAPGVEAGVDLTAYTVRELRDVAAAARLIGRRARVQLKVDTGLGRGGSVAEQWPSLVEAAADAEQSGSVQVTGVWSHLACSDEPDHPANEEQERAFAHALHVVDAVGLDLEVRHLCNSAGALFRPGAAYDLVRCGIASYGLSPAPQVVTGGDLGLVPAMTARARLAMVKRLPAGAGVSYGHTWVAASDTTVGLVPVGYGDGVMRAGSSTASVLVGGRRRPVAGRVCMDQMVVDLGDGEPEAEAGDEVVLFGTGENGAPTAQDWAEACGTISYEIVSRMGGRFRRRHVSARGLTREGAR
ncbi:MAG TPA: alanine racemase [Nocardioidaceae bacterium]|nr:alanine racemase [Nocardioidaceae bacterium]